MNQRELAIEEKLIDLKVDTAVYDFEFFDSVIIPPEQAERIKQDLKKRLTEKLK